MVRMGIRITFVSGIGMMPPVAICMAFAIESIAIDVVLPSVSIQKLANPETRFSVYLIPYILLYTALTLSSFPFLSLPP